MFNYRLSKTLPIEFTPHCLVNNHTFVHVTSKINEKNYIVDYIPLYDVNNPSFAHDLNDSLLVLSSNQDFNVPILPISFWTLVNYHDRAFLILFTENSDGKISLDELKEKEAQSSFNLNPLTKSKISFTIHKVCQHVSKVESDSSEYLNLTEHCVFYNQNQEAYLSFYGLHLLKNHIIPECYNKFFAVRPISNESKIPSSLRSYGKLHYFIENLFEPVQVQFEQSVFNNALKKYESKSSCSSFISSCFDPKTKTPLTYKGCTPKEFSQTALEITKLCESPRTSLDETSHFKVAPDQNRVSSSNMFSKFMSSFIIPYPDDAFRQYVGKHFENYLSYVCVKYMIEFSFTSCIVRRGPKFYENKAFVESGALVDINQEFIDNQKQAALLGSVDALFRLSHFAIFMFDSEPDDEILKILQTASDLGNIGASIDYGIYLATKNFFENIGPDGIDSEILKTSWPYFLKSMKIEPFTYILMSFFTYACLDNEKAIKCLRKAEKYFPEVIEFIRKMEENS